MKNSTTTAPAKKKGFARFINFVEVAGNKLPDPFFLFVAFALIVVTASFIFAKMGVSVTYMAASSGGGAAESVTVGVKNLLDAAYMQKMLKDFVNIYVGFAPLGLVMVMMIAIGFAQNTGLFNAFMKKTLLGAPAMIVTFMLAVMGVCANIASNGGIVFAASIGAALFASLGRNPILGAITGYVAGHGGFSANLIINGTDVLLGGITESAAASIGIVAPTNAMVNYYFLIVATFVIAGATTFVTEKIMPKYMKYGAIDQPIGMNEGLTEAEHKGLKYAGIVCAIFIVGLLACTIPQSGFLRNAEGGILPSSPFVDGITAIIFIFFTFVGCAYGVGAGTIKKQSDVPKFMESGLKGSLSFFVVALPAAFFIQFFNDSKLATVIAIKGAAVLQAMNLNGIALAVGFVLLTGFLNLFMTSGSSKWLILAPIFVPMFSVMNFSPALTQLAYRIGDSITNPIAPVNYFLPVIIAIMTQYKRPEDPEIGLGSIISMTLPYSIAYGIALISLLVIWMLFNIPMGPGAALFL